MAGFRAPAEDDRAPARWRDRWATGGLVAGVLALAVGWRWLSFHSYAVDWDACEYVWAVRESYLPHSPYVLFLWAGKALATLLPADVGLALLSFVSGLAAVALLGVLVRSQTRSTAGAAVAAAGMAAFPVCVRQSGVQEVYALQTALALAAVVLVRGPGSGRAVAGGLLFGAAVAAHQASLLLAPALIYALWYAPVRRGSRRVSRLAAALAAALVLPLAASVWTALLFAQLGADDWHLQWLHYLRGVTPAPRLGELTPLGVAHEARLFAGRALQSTVGSHAPAAALVVLALGAGLLRAPGRLWLWVLWAAPYALYEIALGRNLDRGAYMPFVSPAVAAAMSIAWVALSDRRRGRAGTWRPVAASLGALALLVPPALTSLHRARSVPSRTEFLRSESIAAFRWIRDHAPPQAYVVQPAGVANVNLQPVYTERKPIIYQDGQFRIFAGGRWAPLNLSSFPPLTGERLDALLEQGIAIVSLKPHPSFVRGPPRERRWRRQMMRLDTEAGVERPVYFLERRRIAPLRGGEGG